MEIFGGANGFNHLLSKSTLGYSPELVVSGRPNVLLVEE